MSIRLPSLPLLLFAAVLALATTTAAWAQSGRGRGNDDRGQRSERPEPRRAGPPTPAVREPPQRQERQRRHDDALADAIRRVERSTRGQVISAERMQSDGRDISRIKVMDDRGRVRVYTDDPQQRQRRPQPPTRGDDD